jgi:hypothetical protein
MRSVEQEESLEMHIARDQSATRRHGAFLEHFLLSFINADNKNFDLLRPVMQELMRKYDLTCTCRVLV